jgi:hypothetical protein
MKGQVIERLSEASAERWKTFGEVARAEGWAPTLKLCLIIFVVQMPFDVAFFAYILRR